MPDQAGRVDRARHSDGQCQGEPRSTMDIGQELLCAHDRRRSRHGRCRTTTRAPSSSTTCVARCRNRWKAGSTSSSTAAAWTTSSIRSPRSETLRWRSNPMAEFCTSNMGSPNAGPYLMFSAEWFFDYYLLNRFGDCRATLFCFDNDYHNEAFTQLIGWEPFLKDGERWRAVSSQITTRLPPELSNILVVVIAEKTPRLHARSAPYSIRLPLSHGWPRMESVSRCVSRDAPLAAPMAVTPERSAVPAQLRGARGICLSREMRATVRSRPEERAELFRAAHGHGRCPREARPLGGAAARGRKPSAWMRNPGSPSSQVALLAADRPAPQGRLPDQIRGVTA